MEGTAQFLIWHKVIEALNLIGNTFLSKVQSWEDDPNGNFTTFIDTVNGTVNNFLIAYPPVYANTYDEIDVAMSELVHGEDENTLNNALVTLIELVESSLFTTYGIEAPETKGEESSIEDELNKQAEIFNLVVSSISPCSMASNPSRCCQPSPHGSVILHLFSSND